MRSKTKINYRNENWWYKKENLLKAGEKDIDEKELLKRRIERVFYFDLC